MDEKTKKVHERMAKLRAARAAKKAAQGGQIKPILPIPPMMEGHYEAVTIMRSKTMPNNFILRTITIDGPHVVAVLDSEPDVQAVQFGRAEQFLEGILS